MVGNRFRPQVSALDLLDSFVEQIGIGQLRDKVTKFEIFKNFTGVGRKALNLAFKVILDSARAERREVHCRGVVK